MTKNFQNDRIFVVFSSYLGQDGFIFRLEKLSILEFEL